jgi:hypothetical protein
VSKEAEAIKMLQGDIPVAPVAKVPAVNDREIQAPSGNRFEVLQATIRRLDSPHRDDMMWMMSSPTISASTPVTPLEQREHDKWRDDCRRPPDGVAVPLARSRTWVGNSSGV